MFSFEFPPFRAHPLVIGGHMQTILGACISGIQAPREISIRRHVTLADGDCLLLIDDMPGSKWEPGGDVAILVHGLGGSSESTYVRRISSKLRNEGMRTFRLNLRGCGEGKGLSKQLYHAGRSEDLHAAIEQIRQLCPSSRVFLGGFSLGGNIVLKWLGEYPDVAARMVTKAIAVNPPVNLSACTSLIRKRAFGFYDRYFARMLYRQLLQSFDGTFEPVHKVQPRCIEEFDETITAPRTGFENAQHYYKMCSAERFIADIQVPTLIISAKDDPLIPVSILQSLDRSKSVALHIAESGGHLGYYGRAGDDPDRWWIDWRVVDWFLQPLPSTIALPTATSCCG